MASRLSGQNCKFFKLLSSLNIDVCLELKASEPGYNIDTVYRTWTIERCPYTYLA